MHYHVRSHAIIPSLNILNIFLIIIVIIVTGETRAESIQPNCGPSSSLSSLLTLDLNNPDVPPHNFGTVRTFEGCFQRLRDRFVIVTPKRTRPVPKDLPPCQHFLQNNITMTVYYLVSDICRLGHTTKDAPHLMTFLLDYFAPCSLLCRGNLQSSENTSRLRVQLKILYGNVCASYPAPKSDRPFRTVVLGWFHALFRKDSPFMKLMSSWGIDFITSRSSSNNGEILVEEIYFKEAMQEKGFFCPQNDQVPLDNNSIATSGSFNSDWKGNGGLRIIGRWDRFRWFRTRAQANLFRECLLQYYNPPPRPQETNVLMLRRIGDRHYDEIKWYNKLNVSLLSCQVTIDMQTFASVPYNRQVSFMYNSSIFLAAHGAGFANIMTMSPGSAVIEFFPHGFRYSMYEELAVLLSLHYISYESPMIWPPKCCRMRSEARPVKHLPPLRNKTLAETNFGVRSCKDCDIRVYDDDMRTIIRDALGLVSANVEM